MPPCKFPPPLLFLAPHPPPRVECNTCGHGWTPVPETRDIWRADICDVGHNNGVLGLALETGFDGLTLLGDHMMVFVIGTVKLAVTQGAIVGRPGATHIILTVKSTARGTMSPLIGVIGPIVGVESPFTVYAIIRTVDKVRKGRAAIKMIIGFQ